MYRCRRLITVLLSLALVASAFVISVSAEQSSISDFPLIQLIVQKSGDGVNWGGDNYLDLTSGLQSQLYVNYLRITGIRVNMPNVTDSTFYFRFRYGMVTRETEVIHRTISYTGVAGAKGNTSSNANVSLSGWGNYSSAQNYEAQINSTQWFMSSNTSCIFSGIITFGDQPANGWVTFTFGTPMTFTLSGNDKKPLDILVDYFQSYTNQQAFLQDNFDLLHNSLGSLITAANNIYSVVSYFGTLDNSNYSYTEISYDAENMEFTTNDKTGTYWDALLGSVKSLNADAEAQAAQQEKAKDAGTMDALDNAYEHSSFWDLLHFTDFADFGDYDDDALEDIGENSWLNWFSGTTRNDLDTVARTRDFDDNFFSFYDLNMGLIEDKLSGMLGGDD